jgi:hypothetical protein
MSASRMSSAEYFLQKTYRILCFLYFFLNVANAEMEVGKVENKQNDVKINPTIHYGGTHQLALLHLNL